MTVETLLPEVQAAWAKAPADPKAYFVLAWTGPARLALLCEVALIAQWRASPELDVLIPGHAAHLDELEQALAGVGEGQFVAAFAGAEPPVWEVRTLTAGGEADG